MVVPPPAQGAFGQIHWHYGFVVKIDMNSDGAWETNEFFHGPAFSEYSESATATATRNYSEPSYPSTDVRNITWSIEELRTGYLGAPAGQITSGTASITVLPNPHYTWSESSAPTVEPATLSGYISLDGILDRPLVIVEGYDYNNADYPSQFFGELLTGPTPFIAPLLLAGYDVFVYNHGDATVSMRDNAQRVLGALRAVNEDARYYAPDQWQPTRVMGFSLGGVVTRYALAWGEEYGYDHGCDMFISADAPQQGAWLNIDFQLWLRSLDGSDPTITMFANRLKAPAAKELLKINVFDLTPGDEMPDVMVDEISGTPTYEDFFDDLNILNGDGYPHRTRNIGVSNGKGTISNDTIPASVNPSYVGGFPIATFFVENIPFKEVKFTQNDVFGGSKQPAFRYQSVEVTCSPKTDPGRMRV